MKKETEITPKVLHKGAGFTTHQTELRFTHIEKHTNTIEESTTIKTIRMNTSRLCPPKLRSSSGDDMPPLATRESAREKKVQ